MYTEVYRYYCYVYSLLKSPKLIDLHPGYRVHRFVLLYLGCSPSVVGTHLVMLSRIIQTVGCIVWKVINDSLKVQCSGTLFRICTDIEGR